MAVCIVMECFFRYTTLLIDNCFDGQTNQIHKKLQMCTICLKKVFQKRSINIIKIAQIFYI
jgi:hypothetical protein